MLSTFQAYQLALGLYRGLGPPVEAGAVPCGINCTGCLSVVLTLAEGSAKDSEKERRRFYGIAFASLRETQVLLEITGAKADQISLADRLGAMVYRLSRPRS